MWGLNYSPIILTSGYKMRSTVDKNQRDLSLCSNAFTSPRESIGMIAKNQSSCIALNLDGTLTDCGLFDNRQHLRCH